MYSEIDRIFPRPDVNHRTCKICCYVMCLLLTISIQVHCPGRGHAGSERSMVASFISPSSHADQLPSRKRTLWPSQRRRIPASFRFISAIVGYFCSALTHGSFILVPISSRPTSAMFTAATWFHRFYMRYSMEHYHRQVRHSPLPYPAFLENDFLRMLLHRASFLQLKPKNVVGSFVMWLEFARQKSLDST